MIGSAHSGVDPCINSDISRLRRRWAFPFEFLDFAYEAGKGLWKWISSGGSGFPLGAFASGAEIDHRLFPRLLMGWTGCFPHRDNLQIAI
jgi:hypothetical protein